MPQMKNCKVNYKKNCYLVEEAKASQNKVTICTPSTTRDCDLQGDIICTTEYDNGNYNILATYEYKVPNLKKNNLIMIP